MRSRASGLWASGLGRGVSGAFCCTRCLELFSRHFPERLLAQCKVRQQRFGTRPKTGQSLLPSFKSTKSDWFSQSLPKLAKPSGKLKGTCVQRVRHGFVAFALPHLHCVGCLWRLVHPSCCWLETGNQRICFLPSSSFLLRPCLGQTQHERNMIQQVLAQTPGLRVGDVLVPMAQATATVLGVTSPILNPGIRFWKRTTAKKNGQGINPQTWICLRICCSFCFPLLVLIGIYHY